MPFVSYAQNFEDVLLHRVFGALPTGFYIDVGAWDADLDSVTRAFYDAGWHGINIEPVPALHAALAARRPRDTTLAVALAAQPGTIPFHVFEGTGLSTMDAATAQAHIQDGRSGTLIQVPATTLAEVCRAHAPPEVHFLKIDCEGSERGVLLGADFTAWRPWVVLIEAVEPNNPVPTHAAWEQLMTEAGYRFVWFDGLNRFYVAAERHDALAHHFTTPPNVFDGFVRIQDRPASPSLAPPDLASDVVTAIYRALLLRDPDPEAHAVHTNLLHQPGGAALSIDAVLRSPEFAALQPRFAARYLGKPILAPTPAAEAPPSPSPAAPPCAPQAGPAPPQSA